MLEEIMLVIILLLFSLVIWILVKMSILRKTLEDMKTTVATASALVSTPVDALTQVIKAIQDSVTTLSTSIGDVKAQATKIEMLSKKYEETEKLVRSIHNIMIGSFEKGKSGENYLRNTMNELMKIGLVKGNVSIGSNIVEYCVTFSDGKALAIDSKVVATQDVEAFFDEKTPEKDRDLLRRKIKSALEKKVDEVCKYIDPPTNS